MNARCVVTSVVLAWATVGSAQTASRWQVGTEAVWHDNATNAERPEDLLAGLQWRTDLHVGFRRTLPGGHRLQAAAGVRTEVWPRFEGLNLLAPGLAGVWEFKPGLGPHRPVFSAEGEGEWLVAQERDRGGLAGTVRLQLRQRIWTNWRLLAGGEWQRTDARGRAFDRTGRAGFGRVEWSPARNWTLAVEGRERVGDVVSYSRPPRPDLVAIGKPITFVDTFEQGSPWIAYYFPARTRIGSAEVQHTVGRLSWALRHEYRHTLHAGPGYRNHLTSCRISRAF